MAVPEGAGVSSLVAVTSGLICGLTTGEFYYLQRASEVADGRSGMFRLAHTWSAEGQTAPVSFMSLSPSEDQLSAVFANCQLYSVEIAAPTDLKHDDMKPVVSSFHGPGAITGLDVCIRKPLAITCSLDRTVRVWNYQDRTLDSQKVLIQAAPLTAYRTLSAIATSTTHAAAVTFHGLTWPPSSSHQDFFGGPPLGRVPSLGPACHHRVQR
jgi:cilia- and flagella-associated protein 57